MTGRIEARALEWSEVAKGLLECCDGPAALVDTQGTIRIANRALEDLLGFGPGELGERSIGGLCMSDQGRDKDAAWRAALAGAEVVFELSVRTQAARSLVLVIKPQRLRAGTSNDVLIKVIDSRSVLTQGDYQLAGGDHYELSSRFDNFGALTNVWSLKSGPARTELVGQRCHRALHGLEDPCVGCPVFSQRARTRPADDVVVVPRSSDKLRLDVVETRVTSPTSVAVSVWRVEEALLSHLINGKIGLMAERRGLNTRERSVLDLLVLGRSNDEIGVSLGIANRTVKYYKRKILQKLGAESKHDLMRLIM